MTALPYGNDSLAFVSDASSLAHKLAVFVPLSDADCAALDGLLVSEERFAADTDIIAEGDTPRSVFLLQAGMAVRYRNLPDGQRQIMTFLIPGDLCNPGLLKKPLASDSLAPATTQCGWRCWDIRLGISPSC
ncbi:MAG: Crp/Fnr family transcriptional regulator [Janthinobacterium lividum]